jgi:hypothetical protein
MIGPIPLTATRLEWRPWRVVWDCTGCGRTVSALVGEDALDVLLAAEVAGGMRLSHREIEEARLVDWGTRRCKSKRSGCLTGREKKKGLLTSPQRGIKAAGRRAIAIAARRGGALADVGRTILCGGGWLP